MWMTNLCYLCLLLLKPSCLCALCDLVVQSVVFAPWRLCLSSLGNGRISGHETISIQLTSLAPINDAVTLLIVTTVVALRLGAIAFAVR
jgi:hypothetical protein